MKGNLVPVLFVFLATAAHAEEYGASQDTRALLADEITRHVVDECNLKRIYGKNRIDFDPYTVAVNILPEIHKKLWKNKKELIDKISSVVYPIRSFAKRAMIYDVYYALCIGDIDIERAERQILQHGKEKLSDAFANDDSVILKLYGTYNNNERVQRDESRIRILEYLKDVESDISVKRKNSSVIQEYKHDIELWKF